MTLKANIALNHRLDVILYMIKANREVTCRELLDELVVDLTPCKLNILLKSLVVNGLATMRGEKRKTHYYILNVEFVDRVKQSFELRQKQ